MQTLGPLFILCGALALSACSSGGSTPSATQEQGNTQTPNTENTNGDTSARYRITFNATWSADNHPVEFPGAAAHFSGLVGAVHNDQVVFWDSGQIATDGIELMAETGGKSIFLDEVSAAIASGYASEAIDGPGIATTPGSASVELQVSSDFPNVTLTTKRSGLYIVYSRLARRGAICDRTHLIAVGNLLLIPAWRICASHHCAAI